MKTLQQTTLFSALLIGLWFFFCSAAVLPVEPTTPNTQGVTLTKAQEAKVEKLSQRLEKTKNSRKKARIEEKIRKITYGEQGDALGLAALLGGIVSILLSLAVIIFLGIDWQLLVFVGLIIGAAAIIIGLVDLRYTEMPGQAWAAIVIGALGVIAGVIALIIVK